MTTNTSTMINVNDYINSGLEKFGTFLMSVGEKLTNSGKPLYSTQYIKAADFGSQLHDFATNLRNHVLITGNGDANTMSKIDILNKNSQFYKSKADAMAKQIATNNSGFKIVNRGLAGVGLLELGNEAVKAVETGNYDKLGEKASEILGSAVGVGLATAILTAAGVLAAPGIVAFAIAASVLLAAAYFGDKLGAYLWDRFMTPARDWLSDKFSDWFGINRTGLFHIYDPLVLDLDGDGIELVNANGWNGVQFDFNGNGIQTATQWVKADDGLLVWDRNNNGVIDDGSELFGQDTPHRFITDPVTDGFTALRTVENMECKNSTIYAANDTIFAFQAA